MVIVGFGGSRSGIVLTDDEKDMLCGQRVLSTAFDERKWRAIEHNHTETLTKAYMTPAITVPGYQSRDSDQACTEQYEDEISHKRGCESLVK
jgi:hypothetical protein